MRRGDWNKIWNDWLDADHVGDAAVLRRTKSKATTATNALRAYYEDDGSTLWVTFYAGDLYWCFLEPGEPMPVSDDERQTSTRRVKGHWSNLDYRGVRLSRSSLPGDVNMVAMFQGTTCLVRAADKLLRRINGERTPEVEALERARDMLEESVKPLIGNLTWQDFEVLADLLMSGSGWRRVDRIGGTEKTIDLDLELPLTGERAFAQVKANSSQAQLNEYIREAGERIGFKNVLRA